MPPQGDTAPNKGWAKLAGTGEPVSPRQPTPEAPSGGSRDPGQGQGNRSRLGHKSRVLAGSEWVLALQGGRGRRPASLAPEAGHTSACPTCLVRGTPWLDGPERTAAAAGRPRTWRPTKGLSPPGPRGSVPGGHVGVTGHEAAPALCLPASRGCCDDAHLSHGKFNWRENDNYV